jgi:hypothetical protein
VSSEHAIATTEATNFVLLFRVTDDHPELEVYIGHAQTMDPHWVCFLGVLK